MDSSDKFHFFFPFRVRYNEVDSQGIVFNSRYLEYCDGAVTEYFRALGFPPLELAGVHHLDMVLVRVEIDFSAPGRLDDLLHVYVRTAHIGRSSFTCQFEIRRAEDQTVLTRVQIKYVNVDPKTGKSAPVPENVRDAIEAFEGKAI